GPAGPDGSWPALNFAAVSVPFLTLAPVTEFAFSWAAPTELPGRTNLVAACPSGVVPNTATARAVKAIAVFTFSFVFTVTSFRGGGGLGAERSREAVTAGRGGTGVLVPENRLRRYRCGC